MTFLLYPPFAFFLYTGVAICIYLIGRILAGPGNPSKMKSSLYSSGEEAPISVAVPGYRPFFLVAIFFAMLHLGVLMLGTGTPSPILIFYVGGLMLALLALILG
jgi:NADH:ubiquinone oxidoreductase subunit 3 (subunit A)